VEILTFYETYSQCEGLTEVLLFEDLSDMKLSKCKYIKQIVSSSVMYLRWNQV
jgi:hypothetical protein